MRHVLGQHGADEVLPDAEAVLRALGQETAGQATSNPEPPQLACPSDFENVEGSEVQPGNATGQTLGLAQQRNRSGPEDEETPGSLAAPAPLVYDAPEFGEELRRMVDLVQDDQPILVGLEEGCRIRQHGAVPLPFQVEIERVASRRDGQCQRGLSDLPRPDQADRSLASESRLEVGVNAAQDHCCISTVLWWICAYSSPTRPPVGCRFRSMLFRGFSAAPRGGRRGLGWDGPRRGTSARSSSRPARRGAPTPGVRRERG